MLKQLMSLVATLNHKNISLIFTGLFALLCSYQYYSGLVAAADYNNRVRQISGHLSEKERELTAQRVKFNQLKSTLEADKSKLQEQALNLRSQYGQISQEYQDFVSSHNLEVQQYQKSIHRLRSTIKSTKQNPARVEIVQQAGSCTQDSVISYTYEEPHGRVKLQVPNCLKTGDETISFDQSFIIYGEVLKQKDGALKVSNLTLTEVSPEDPKLVLGRGNLVDSDFTYLADPLPPRPEKKFHLVSALGIDHKYRPTFSIGYLPFKFRQYHFGLALNVNTDYTYYPALKALYRPKFLMEDLNLGASFNVGFDIVSKDFLYLLAIDFFIW